MSWAAAVEWQLRAPPLLLSPFGVSLVFSPGLAGRVVPCLVTFHIKQGAHGALHVDSAKTINALGGITLICAPEAKCCHRVLVGRILLILKIRKEEKQL
jgi:hypothetical protein